MHYGSSSQFTHTFSDSLKGRPAGIRQTLSADHREIVSLYYYTITPYRGGDHPQGLKAPGVMQGSLCTSCHS